MQVDPISWTEAGGWQANSRDAADLILYFGNRSDLAGGVCYDELATLFPRAHLVGCSTGGQIQGVDITDDGIVGVALSFSGTSIRVVCEQVPKRSQSREIGSAIAAALRAADLAGIFVLADGLQVNGSELIDGIVEIVGANIPVTGGMAGDGPHFEETIVGGDCAPMGRAVAAIGFYGSAIRLGCGCSGGWSVFGPRRRITRSDRDILYELEGVPALDLYRRYVGEEHVDDFALAALPFPLKIYDPEHPEHSVVRTVLSADLALGSMRFAGDVPKGWVAQLMRGNFDRLTDAAAEAARKAAAPMSTDVDGVAVLVSCIGRRALMGQRIVDELEAADTELPQRFQRVGFYSYGEIAPDPFAGICGLHNQTMTITTIGERRE